jgi:putative transposase
MARRAYSEINLHLVWHVKDNQPALSDEIRAPLYRYLRGRALQQTGVFWHDVGGTNDHVHIAVSVPPTLMPSELIGELKGASAHYINHEIANRKILEWQTGYGVVSFGTKDLPWVLEYVRNQPKHHADGTTFERLERAEADEDEKPGKPG